MSSRNVASETGEPEWLEDLERPVGHRGATKDLSRRQNRVLLALNEPLDEEHVERWIDAAIKATAGDHTQAVRSLLLGRRFRLLNTLLLTADTELGEWYRGEIQRTLIGAFGDPMRQLMMRDAPAEDKTDRRGEADAGKDFGEVIEA